MMFEKRAKTTNPGHSFGSNEELRQSRAFLDSLIENLPDMVFVKDAKDLKFVRFNKAGEELLGYSRDQLIGKSDFDFFPREQAEYFIEKDRAVLRAGNIVDIPQEPIQTKNKGTRILHTKKIPLLGPSGETTHLLGIAEDITERVRAEEERLRIIREEAALQEREHANKRMAILAEASTTLASSLDYRETLKKIAQLMVPQSADWCTVTIQQGEDQLERVAAVHRDSDKSALIKELLRNYSPRVVVNGESSLTPIITDEMLVREAYDERHLEIMRSLGVHSCMLIPIPGRNKILGTIAFVSGSSQRIYTKDDLEMAEDLGKRAGIAIDNAILFEAAQKASEVRDEFLSIASHELKTPLTSLSLQLQAARRTALRSQEPMSSEKLAKVFDVSLKQVRRLSTLIEDLLDVSKIAAGKMNLHLGETDLSALIRDMTNQFSSQLEQAKCTVDLDVQPAIRGFWDQNRIEQVLANLISNSVKYAPGCAIRIQAITDPQFARIVVQDYGPGIPKEKQQKIFERFERATQSKSISGLGLGLFIVKQIVLAHRGSVTVKSEPGSGTSFEILLPLA